MSAPMDESRPLSDEHLLREIKELALQHLDLPSPEALEAPARELLALRLVDDLGLDSIQLLTLAVEVENHFEVALDGFAGDAEDQPGQKTSPGEITTQEITTQEITTLGDLIVLVRQQLRAKGSS